MYLSKELMTPGAFVFDACGTLFDVQSVAVRAANFTGDLHALSALGGRNSSNIPGCDHSWSLQGLLGGYRGHVTRGWQLLKIPTSDAELHGLMQAYLRPSAFPDVTEALNALQGAPLAILSNGSPKRFASAVQHKGLTSFFTEIVSVDGVWAYKHPQSLRTGARGSGLSS